MANELGGSDFRILSSRLLDRIMPLPVSAACLSAAYLAGPNWFFVIALSFGFIAVNFWLSALVVGPIGVTRPWLVGYGRTAVSLCFLPTIVYLTGSGGYGWYVALPSVATLPFAFQPGKARGPIALLILVVLAARYFAGCTLAQGIVSTTALGTTAMIVGGLATALKREIDRALRAERAQSDFLATMSHEIRTPMHGVLASLDLMDTDNLTTEQCELLSAARGSASGLLMIINDVLDFSKIQAGKLSVDPVVFRLDQLVQQLNNEFAPRAAEEGTTLHVAVDPALPDYLTGDPLRIAQIVRNYLSNALKFGRGTVVTLAASATVEGQYCHLRIQVKDEGPGVPVEDQGRLFARFEQISQGATRAFGGTGLGLAISRQLAELMGGEVGILSEPGQGATFWVTLTLPVAKAPANPGLQETLQVNVDLDVLIVDDNAVNRMVATRMLQKLGCLATAVEGGKEAIELLSMRAFDCVLMDCQMPEMDGFEATRSIRLLPGRTNIPVIAVTAGVLEQDRVRCEQAGMDGFLAKPLNKIALAQVLSGLPRVQPVCARARTSNGPSPLA
jgi:signal transduction histidine kinase/CheY-like chemotaxis protein